jgi:hypothetical protein
MKHYAQQRMCIYTLSGPNRTTPGHNTCHSVYQNISSVQNTRKFSKRLWQLLSQTSRESLEAVGVDIGLVPVGLMMEKVTLSKEISPRTYGFF